MRVCSHRSRGAPSLCPHATEPQSSPTRQACDSAAKCVRCASWALLRALSYGGTGRGVRQVPVRLHTVAQAGGLGRYRSDAWAPHTPAVALAVRTGHTHVTRGAQAGVLVLGQPSGSPDPGPPHTAAQEGRAESQVSPRISQELPLSASHGTGMTGRGTAGSCHLWGQNLPRLQGLHCEVFESQTACLVLHTWLCSVQNPAHVILCDMPTAWLPGQEACPGGVAAGGG